MFTFFVRGFAFLGERILETRKERSAGSWGEYQKIKQFEQEIQKTKERVFLQQLVW